jgi:hypothetical protein
MKTQRWAKPITWTGSVTGRNAGTYGRATDWLISRHVDDEVFDGADKNGGFFKASAKWLLTTGRANRVRPVSWVQSTVPVEIRMSRTISTKALALVWLIRWVCAYSLVKMCVVVKQVRVGNTVRE